MNRFMKRPVITNYYQSLPIKDQSLPIKDQSLPIKDQSLLVKDQPLPVKDQFIWRRKESEAEHCCLRLTTSGTRATVKWRDTSPTMFGMAGCWWADDSPYLIGYWTLRPHWILVSQISLDTGLSDLTGYWYLRSHWILVSQISLDTGT